MQGLVAHLTFDTDLTDSSGRGNHAAAVGAPNLVPGFIGAGGFNPFTQGGTNNYATLGTGSDFSFGTATDFSIAFWARLPAGGWNGTSTHSDPAFISNKDWSDGNNHGWVVATGSDGRLQWNYTEAGNQTRKDYDGPAGVFGNPVWHHVAVTFQRTRNAITYFDGVPVSTNSIGPGTKTIDPGLPTNIGNDGTGDYPINYGYWTNAFANPTNGLAMDDLGIWRRVVSAKEICAIYNAGLVGQDLSTVTSADLTTTVLPRIAQQPVSRKGFVGNAANFSVTASGTAPVAYQWFGNGVCIVGGTGASLALSNVQPAHAGSYFVVITNAAGSVTSAVATLDLIAVPLGSYLEAVVTNSPLAFWRLGELDGTTAFDYVGGNNATYANVTLNQPGALATDSDTAASFDGTNSCAGTGLSLANNCSAFTMEGWYKLVAGSKRMGFWGQNNAIEFGLSDPNTIQIWTPNGGSLNVTNTWSTNSWHHLAAVGNGTNLLLYVDGYLAGTGGSATTNYGSSSYSFNIGGGGIFDAATNWFNGCLDEIAFYNRALPATNVQRHYLLGLALPAITLTAPTDSATFTTPATINLAATVVTNGHTIAKVQFFDGATLLTEALAAPYTYAWSCAVAGTYSLSAVAVYDSGSVTSSVAMVTVFTPPSITTQPLSQALTAGQDTSFSVVANGSAPFSYQWNFNGSAISGATDASLALTNVQTTDAGCYTAVVTNPGGSITSEVATLTVNIPPGITAQPQSLTVTQGQITSFSVVASGTAPLSYQWSLNGAALSDATSSTLTLNNVQTTDAGNYTVVVTNVAGSLTSAVATLTVTNPAPPAPPSMGAAGMTTNGFTFQLSVSVGQTYVILATTNLQDWAPISTNVALTGDAVITDPATTNYTRRFYRVMVQ
jgi:hypothetical protein